MSNITAKPLKPKNVDVSNISFSSVKTMPSGAKTVYVNYNGGLLFLQSPEMNVPFDTATYYPDNDNSGKWPIQVAMDNIKGNPTMKEFHDTIAKMDNHLISQATECAPEWFKTQQWFKKKGDVGEKVADNYKPMVKVSLDSDTGEPDGRWPPKFNFKIIKRDGKVLCDCYDSNKNQLTTDGDGAINLETMFKKGTKVKTILRCKGIWISNVGWGCTWGAEQIKIDVPMGFSGYAFDDSDDEDEGVSLTRQSTAPAKPADNFVSSDEEGVDGGSEGGGSEGGGSEGGGSDGGDSKGSGSDDESGESDGEEVETKVVKRKVKK